MAAQKVELVQAYISLIPSAANMTANLEKELVGPATKAGKNAGSAVSKEIGGGISAGLKSISKDVGSIGQDIVKSLNLVGPLGAEISSMRGLMQSMSSSFRMGFGDAQAAASSFTGVMGTLGGKTRAAIDTAVRPISNLVTGFKDSEAAASSFTGVMGTVGGRVRSTLQSAAVPFQNLAAGFTSTSASASALTGMMGTLGGAARRVYDVAAAPAQNFLAGLKSQDAASSALTGKLGTLGGATRRVYDVAAAPAQNFLSGLKSQDAASSALTGRMGSLGGAISRAGGTMSSAFAKAGSVFGSMNTGIKNFVGGLQSADAAASATSGRMGTLGGFVSRTAGTMQSLGSQASAATSRIGSGFSAVTSSAVGFGVKAAGAIATVGAGIAGMAVTGGLNRALQIEQATAKLTGLGNSAQDVDTIMKNATASVKGTAFGLGEAATTAAGAVAAGIKPGEQLEGVLKTVSNSAAIAGVDMNSMGSIFNKVAATGKLQGDELLQLSDAGVPALAFLAKETGKTSAEVSDMVSKGQIDFDTFARAMKNGVGNAAFEMGKTTTGSFMNLKAAIGRLGAGAIQPFLPLINKLFGGLTAGADAASKIVAPFFEGVAKKITVFSDALGLLSGNTLTQDIVMKMGFTPGSPMFVGLTELVGGIRAFAGAWKAADGQVTSSGFPGFMERAANAIHGFLNWAKQLSGGAIAGIAAVIAPVAAGIGYMATQAIHLTGPIGSLLARFTPLAGILAGVGGALKFMAGPWGTVISLIVAAVTQSAPLRAAFGDLFGALVNLGKTIFQAVAPAFQALQGPMSGAGAWFQGLVGFVTRLLQVIVPVVTTIINQFAPAIGGFLAGAVQGAVAVIGFLVGALMKVGQWLAPLVIQLVSFLAPALTFVTGLIAEGVKILGGPFGKILGGLAGVVAVVVGAMWAWTAATVALNVASGILAGIWAVITSPITLIVAAILLVVGAVVLAYNKIGWFRDAVNAAWNGIVVAAQFCWNLIVTVIGAVVNWFQTVVGPIFMTVVTAIGGFFTWLWQSVIVPVWGFIMAVIGAVVTWFQTIVIPGFQAAITLLGNVFSWLWHNIIEPVWNGIRVAIAIAVAIIMTIFDGIKWFINAVLAPVFTWLWQSVIVPVWNGIVSVISWAWNNMVLPIWNAIRGFINGVLIPVFQWLGDKVNAVWNWIVQAISWAWNNMVLPIWNALKWYVEKGLIPVFQWLGQKVSDIWNWIVQAIQWAWNTQVLPIWNALRDFINGVLIPAFQWLGQKVSDIWNWISDAIAKAWNWIRDTILKPMGDYLQNTVVDFFNKTKDGIKNVWNKIQDIVKEPVKFVINTIIRDGLVKHFNDIAGKFGVDPIKFDGVGWATGGYTGRGRKHQPAGVVHKDEYVVNKESTNRIRTEHGLGAMDYLNRTGDLTGAANLSKNAGGENLTSKEAREKNKAGNQRGIAAGPGTGVYGGLPSFGNQLQHDIARMGQLSVEPSGLDSSWNIRSAANVWNGMSGVKVGTNMKGNSPRVTARQMSGASWAGYYDTSGIQLNIGQQWANANASRPIVAMHEIGHALGLPHSMGTGGGASIMDYGSMYGLKGPSDKDAKALQAIYPGGDGKGREGGGGGFNPLAFVMDLLKDQFKKKFPKANMAIDLAWGMGKKAIQAAIDSMNIFGGDDDGGKGGPVPEGNVKDWMTKALKIKNVFSESNLSSGVRRAMQESGGDPRAFNGWDVNAQNGNPSKGLMQVVGTTFAENKEPGHGDIWNPIDNILASINYTLRTYGSLRAGWDRAGGYAMGGLVGAPTTVFDGGGWLHNTGHDQLIRHNKRKPDAVLSSPQWSDVHALVQHVADGDSGARIENHWTIQERPERSPEHMALRMSEEFAHQMRREGLVR